MAAFLAARASLTLFLMISSAIAATVNYDFNITWVTAQPDGFSRPTIGINGQWPIPPITATVGDRVVVDVHNQLGNQTTSLHFHGLYMNGSSHMDGAVGASQCTIPVGGSFVYDFKVSASCFSHKIWVLLLLDRSAGYLLVSFSRYRTVSRWLTWSADRH